MDTQKTKSMTSFKKIILAPLLFIGFSVFAQTKDHVYVTGSKCFIIPPKDFIVSAGFSGLQNKTRDASILVSVIKKSKEEILSTYHTDSLKSKGFTFIDKKDVKVSGYDGQLIKVMQDSKKIYKEVLVFEESGECIVVNAMYPEKNKAIEPEITSAMLSIIYDKNHIEKIQESTLFAIKVNEEKFKIAKNFYGSLIYTSNGEMNAESAEKPMLVIAKTNNNRPIGDRIEYAKERTLKNGRVKTATVKSTNNVKQDGLEGVECISEGVDKNGKKVTSYNTYLFDEKSVFTIQITDPESKDMTLKEYKEMVSTFKRKK